MRGPQTGVLDTTGRNSGNWTITFDAVLLNFNVPEVFIYKMNMQGALGSSFDVAVENQTHDTTIFGNQNSWFDESDSLVLRPGENFYLFFSDPVADMTPPVATVFLRYDITKWGTIYPSGMAR